MAADRSLAALTFCRFLAAFAVVLYHFGEQVWPIDVAPWNRLIRVGAPAVTFFFVLSGYIMVRVHRDITFADAPAYWWARFARIYPVYILGLLGVALTARGDWPSLITQTLLLQAWIPSHALAWNWVGWSLSVEAFFYVLFPALAMLARRMGPPWWTAGTLAAWTATLFWVATLNGFISAGDPSWSQEFVDYFPLHHLAAFLAGMTAGVLSRGASLRKGVARLAVLSGVGTAGALLFLNGPPSAHGVPLPAFVPCFSLLVIGVSGLDLGRAWRLLTFLGEASYALYVLHIPVALLTVRVVLPPRPPAETFKVLSFLLPSLVALSCLVFAYYETPLRNKIREWSRRTASPRRRVQVKAY